MIPLYRNTEFVGTKREQFFRRSQADIESLTEDVRHWITKVKQEGDRAVVEYIRRFDDADFLEENIRISEEEITQAYNNISPHVLEMIRQQILLSKKFHTVQADKIFAESNWEMESVPGVRIGMRKVPLSAVGLYVPAGKAPLPTVAQILTVAAKAARVPRIVVCFPPTDTHNEIIVAAHEAGADEIYRVGGIAAIAAMAYGTESLVPVDKISGPGSPWVQAAKLQVFGQVGIDMMAGPSEGLIMADETAAADFVAADVLARCEHGPDSCMPIVTNSLALAHGVLDELQKQLPTCNRKAIIQESFGNGYNGIILADTPQEMIDIANEYGAEHLEIQMNNAEEISKKIQNAGSIFIGEYAPVPVGDYASGTNHSLPTGRAVKYSSPVGVETFVKNIEFQILTKQGIKNLEPIVETLSDIEGLDAHKNAVLLRNAPTRDRKKTPQISDFKGVIFDMDGVLINSESIWHDNEMGYLQTFIPLSEADFVQTEIIGRSIFGIFDWLTEQYPEHMKDVNRNDFLKQYQEFGTKHIYNNTTLYPSVLEILQDIQGQNIPLALASSSPLKWVDTTLQRHCLEAFFPIYTTGCMVKNAKPDPEIFLKTAEKMNISPADILVFEDSKNGVLSAKTAGMTVFGYRNDANENQDLSLADMIFYDFGNLRSQK